MSRNRARLSRVALVAVLAAVCVTAPGCTAASERASVTIGGVSLEVDVVRDTAGREAGLTGYDPLSDGEGMAFVWDEPSLRTFVMKDVSFPIDVVFVGQDGRISEVFPLDPGDREGVSGAEQVALVLEVPRGWLSRNELGVGSEVDASALSR